MTVDIRPLADLHFPDQQPAIYPCSININSVMLYLQFGRLVMMCKKNYESLSSLV